MGLLVASSLLFPLQRYGVGQPAAARCFDGCSIGLFERIEELQQPGPPTASEGSVARKWRVPRNLQLIWKSAGWALNRSEELIALGHGLSAFF